MMENHQSRASPRPSSGVANYARLALMAGALLIAISFGFAATRGNTSLKPIVYLIPSDFVGPVFVFFGQKDGVDTIPDPLGNAVVVPRNGVIKLKGTVDDLISRDRSVRNLYWVAMSREGKRTNLWIVNALSKADNGDWIYSYFDEAGKLHQASGAEASGYFAHIPQARRNDRMIMSHDGCKHQRFSPPGAPDSTTPDCAKFLIVSPTEYRQMPDWVWDDTNHEYRSIREFEDEANARALKLKEHYKRPDAPTKREGITGK